MAIEKGDVVELKSGGPSMTVQTLGNWEMKGIEDGAMCVWFDGKTKHQDVFDVAVLKPVDEAYRGRV
ncbi:YodC family protein [Pseudomonas sp. RL_105y_Pfl2_101]|uniref:YodC family protein n=1 Tax=Pseudomonas sp. RL_105y_Pfl2_101 TaxID=3088708 RepID=UPI0030D9871E